jgi:hypothetical protein
MPDRLADRSDTSAKTDSGSRDMDVGQPRLFLEFPRRNVGGLP